MPNAPLIRLDTSAPNERRWAQPPVQPSRILRCDAKTHITTLWQDGRAMRLWADPLEALRWLEIEATTPSNEPARWIGFLSYDLGRLFERLPSIAPPDFTTPLFAFACVQSGALLSHFPNTEPGWLLQQPPTPIDNHHRISKKAPQSNIPPQTIDSPLRVPRSNFSPQAYRAAVERVLEYIRAGDIFQANLSQRFTLDCALDAELIYRRLLEQSPARYGALLDFGDFALISNSPELFLRVEANPKSGARRITTRPIKGTRPRGAGMEAELRESAKDAAELNMIVDLERNDLGKICAIGSVKVTQPRAIESHPAIYHGVAAIQGVLRSNITFLDILRAAFPGGSVTGAPKIRAMEIIEEMEGIRRGAYCGAIGYLASDGTIEFNVAIRTIVLARAIAQISVGGGIVIDSNPADEYAETLVKARAMFAALGLTSPDAFA